MTILTRRSGVRSGIRSSLLGTAALACMAAGSAHAQSGVIDPGGVQRDAQGAAAGVINPGAIRRS
jgi:hypothetical protein